MAKEIEEQLDLIDVRTVHGKKIITAVKKFVAQRQAVKNATLKRNDLSVAVVELVRESDLKPIDAIGTIKVTVEGFTVTVTPHNDSLAVKETTTGDQE